MTIPSLLSRDAEALRRGACLSGNAPLRRPSASRLNGFLFVALLLPIFISNGRAADNDEKVNAAILKGANYLQGADYKNGNSHGIGTVALAGLALMEAEMKPNSPFIQSMAQKVREEAVGETGTYPVALAIIFLDRLGEARDIGLIQILGARLMTSQTAIGGWGYAASSALNENDIARIRASAGSPSTKEKLNPEAARMIIAFSQGQRSAASLGGDDNSNTQFALVALWVARRNGVPCDTSFMRLQSRFIRSQSPGNGGWGYTSTDGSSTPSMSCAGLLALATAKAASEMALKGVKPGAPTDGAKPMEEEDPFLKPPAPGEKREEDANAPEAAPEVDPNIVNVRDKAIERGLAGVGALLQGQGHVGTAIGNYGGVDDLYFFWSLERVCVAYGLDTIGGVDWYKWGVTAILPAQKADGSWQSQYDQGIVGTSFALLFLKKANFTSDLSRQIKDKIKDPGSGELRGGRGVGPTPIQEQGSAQNRKPGEDPKAAAINKVRPTTEADKICEGLVTATDREWKVKLTAARDTKGQMWTLGLTMAMAQLEGRRLYQAREALAERLVRMTPETLKAMLADRDAELRRAACLAIGMKDDWTLIPEMIERVTDPNEIVVRAAKASMKAMSGEDHGPKSGADDTAKRAAADAWRFWHATAIRKKQ
ncbi:hypothetical protein BH11PLA2_BH11PLA2_30770 [soil metagenome]